MNAARLTRHLFQTPVGIFSGLAAANARRGYALQKVTKKIKVLKKPRESVTLPEALRILRAWDVGNPQHQVEVHIKCAVEKSSPVVRGSIVLPKSIKQEATILVFAEGKAAEDAKQAGAHIVGGTELIPRVEAGEFKFDKCLCTPALLPAVAKIARYLGPKNLMPSVKRGTVTDDMAAAVQASKSLFEYKSDRNGVVHVGIARLGFTDEEVAANLNVLINNVKENGPGGKKSFIEQVHISSTRGPGLLLKDI